MATPILLFDVNETLLDIGALDPLFESALGEAEARREWFLTLQTLWMTATLAGRYTPFSELARAALEMTAARRERQLARTDRDAILTGITRLPPHPDVPGALEQLASCGVRLAALSNGTTKGLRAQLRHANVAQFFERLISVDEVRRYKPAPEPYRYAAKQLGVRRSNVDLVSVHSWDLAGARAAGLSTIFVRRPGHPPNPADSKADIEVADIGELARNIAARRGRRPSRAVHS
jgi:2-haloacid dehalogenase